MSGPRPCLQPGAAAGNGGQAGVPGIVPDAPPMAVRDAAPASEAAAAAARGLEAREGSAVGLPEGRRGSDG
eukprot:11233250-Heterocapsa_arctica.AAC.1